MDTKRFFITGAAGFIGSHTAETLVKQGHTVVGFDNFAPAYPRAKKEFNLEQVRKAAPEPEKFHFIEGDLRDADFVLQCLKQQPCDSIIHLGALAGVQPSLADPQAYTAVNIQGSLNIFEAARHLGIHSIVSASSSSVYGSNDKLPFSESDPVDHPISPYAATKKAGELMAYTYHHLFKLNIACLRFFTVYGPRQRPDLAIYKFARAMLRDESITLYGDGSSSRDYTFISDIVAGIILAAQWTLAGSDEAPRYDIFNLGESQTVKLNQLVELLEKNLSTQAKRKHADYLPGDVFATFADLNHAKDVLGYAPSVKIETGIQKFCEWFLAEEKDKEWA